MIQFSFLSKLKPKTRSVIVVVSMENGESAIECLSGYQPEDKSHIKKYLCESKIIFSLSFVRSFARSLANLVAIYLKWDEKQMQRDYTVNGE